VLERYSLGIAPELRREAAAGMDSIVGTRWRVWVNGLGQMRIIFT
jgi:hypothetical protein